MFNVNVLYYTVGVLEFNNTHEVVIEGESVDLCVQLVSASLDRQLAFEIEVEPATSKFRTDVIKRNVILLMCRP